MQGVRLQWVGFTEEQVRPTFLPTMADISGSSAKQLPAIYKSNGVLSFLQRTRRPGQGRWTASLDTNTLARREGKQESYWPVSVGSNQMHVIILKVSHEPIFFSSVAL